MNSDGFPQLPRIARMRWLVCIRGSVSVCLFSQSGKLDDISYLHDETNVLIPPLGDIGPGDLDSLPRM